MPITQKTTTQIINETVRAYADAPSKLRAIADGQCVYFDPETGNKCAVGRCCDPEQVSADDFPTCSINSKFKSSIETRRILAALLPEYQGHPVEFWKDLQVFHDGSLSWDVWGLSDYGKGLVNRLKRKYETPKIKATL